MPTRLEHAAVHRHGGGGEVCAELNDHVREALVDELSAGDIADIAEEMETDDAVALLEPSFGGINLEDIASPKCFYILDVLRKELDIPVFHDDQHGTAIVVLAALKNSLKLVNKKIEECKIIINGVGAAGTAIAHLLVLSGAKNIIGFDRKGAINKNRESNDEMRQWFIDHCNSEQFNGSLSEAMNGADIFIGVSAPNVLIEDDIQSMAQRRLYSHSQILIQK